MGLCSTLTTTLAITYNLTTTTTTTTTTTLPITSTLTTITTRAVDELAAVTPGKESRAMTSFANALRQVSGLGDPRLLTVPLLMKQILMKQILTLDLQLPSIIAENGGYDSAQLVSELKAKHILGEATMGLNMTEGSVGCMQELGITESFSVKRQVLVQASEAAEMILRSVEIFYIYLFIYYIDLFYIYKNCWSIMAACAPLTPCAGWTTSSRRRRGSARRTGATARLHPPPSGLPGYYFGNPGCSTGYYPGCYPGHSGYPGFPGYHPGSLIYRLGEYRLSRLQSGPACLDLPVT